MKSVVQVRSGSHLAVAELAEQVRKLLKEHRAFRIEYQDHPTKPNQEGEHLALFVLALEE
jgi:hypothetical protein